MRSPALLDPFGEMVQTMAVPIIGGLAREASETRQDDIRNVTYIVQTCMTNTV